MKTEHHTWPTVCFCLNPPCKAAGEATTDVQLTVCKWLASLHLIIFERWARVLVMSRQIQRCCCRASSSTGSSRSAQPGTTREVCDRAWCKSSTLTRQGAQKWSVVRHQMRQMKGLQSLNMTLRSHGEQKKRVMAVRAQDSGGMRLGASRLFDSE